MNSSGYARGSGGLRLPYPCHVEPKPPSYFVKQTSARASAPPPLSLCVCVSLFRVCGNHPAAILHVCKDRNDTQQHLKYPSAIRCCYCTVVGALSILQLGLISSLTTCICRSRSACPPCSSPREDHRSGTVSCPTRLPCRPSTRLRRNKQAHTRQDEIETKKDHRQKIRLSKRSLVRQVMPKTQARSPGNQQHASNDDDSNHNSSSNLACHMNPLSRGPRPRPLEGFSVFSRTNN